MQTVVAHRCFLIFASAILLKEIQKTTGHMNLEILRRYIRDGEMFGENASKKLGL